MLNNCVASEYNEKCMTMIMLSMYAKSCSDVRQLDIDTLNLAPSLVGKGAGSERKGVC